jgi:hypothetical protein
MPLQDAMKLIREKKPTSSAALQSVRDTLAVDLAQQAVQELETERQRLLLEGNDKQVLAIEQEITIARLDVERTNAAIAELDKRIAAALSAEGDQAKREQYSAARKKVDEAVRRLAAEYDPAARKIVELISLAVESLAALSAANQNLPDGAESIALPPVLIRGRGAMAEEIVRERVIDQWVFDSSGERVGHQEKVLPNEADPDTGLVGVSVHSFGSKCRRAKFKEVTFLPYAPPSTAAELYRAVNLPALVEWHPPYWTPDIRSDQVLERAVQSLLQERPTNSDAPRPDRVAQVRYEPVDKPQSGKDGKEPERLIVDGGVSSFAPMMRI